MLYTIEHTGHALLGLVHSGDICFVLLDLLLHHEYERLSGLVWPILIDEVVNVEIQRLNVLDLFGVMSWINTKDADQFEEIEENRSRKSQQMG